MENLKLLRKVKKINQQRNQREQRERNAATSIFRKLDFDDDIPSLTNENHFEKLPDALVLEIFKRISRPVLLRYAIVSKRWNRLIVHESLWDQFDLSNKTVPADILIQLLNKGVRIFKLGRAEIRRSLKKSFNQQAASKSSLAYQLDCYLASPLRIECLDLTNTTIDTCSLNKLLSHTKSLRKISLESLDLDDETFQHLSGNPSIDTLNLCLCRNITVDGIISMLNSLKHLRSLNVAWINIEREGVVLMCKHLPASLERLNLSGCKLSLLDSDIRSLVSSCPRLVELDVSDCESLTNLSVQYIADGLEFIEHLAFSRCYSITPSSYFLLGEAPNLVALDLFNILNEKSFNLLKENIPSLLYLNRYMFSSIARPKATSSSSSAWSQRLAEITLLDHGIKPF